MYELFRVLFPEMTNEQQQAVSRIVWRVVITSYIVWSLGAFSTMGFPGFAREEKVDAVQERLTMIMVLVSEDNLLNARKAQCSAISKEFATKRLGQLLREYRILTGTDWDIPQCQEIV